MLLLLLQLNYGLLYYLRTLWPTIPTVLRCRGHFSTSYCCVCILNWLLLSLLMLSIKFDDIIAKKKKSTKCLFYTLPSLEIIVVMCKHHRVLLYCTVHCLGFVFIKYAPPSLGREWTISQTCLHVIRYFKHLYIHTAFHR